MKRLKRDNKEPKDCGTGTIASLFHLATNVFVKHVNIVKAYSEHIPTTLYDSLLKASLKTDRLLSTRHLLLSWPFKELSMVNCDEFKEEHAVILAHSLNSTCKNLRVVNLTGCNIGKGGNNNTPLFYMGSMFSK